MAIIRNEDIDTYHANPAESNTSLKDFIENGPFWWKRCYIDKVITKGSTVALRAGSAVDTMITEPEEYAKRYVMQPEFYPAGKGEMKPWHNGATFCKEFNADIEARGLIAVTESDHKRYCIMREKVLAHPLAGELVAAAEKQVTLRRKIAAWAFDLQARPDFSNKKPLSFTRKCSWTADLKKTCDFDTFSCLHNPSHPKSGKAISEYGYHRQGAIDNVLASLEDYTDPLHLLVVVEDCEPYRVGVFEIPPSYLEIGWAEVERAGSALAQCLRTNVWPGSPTELVAIAPPEWMVRREERLAEKPAAAIGGAA